MCQDQWLPTRSGKTLHRQRRTRKLTYHRDRLQSIEKFRNGEIDIDNLCAELRTKAKHFGGVAVVEEKYVNRLLGLGV